MNTYIKDIKKLLMSLQKEGIEDSKTSIPIRNVMKFIVNNDIELSRAIRTELVRLGLPDTVTNGGLDKVGYLFAYFKDFSRGTDITKSDNGVKYYTDHRGIGTTLEELKLMEKENE